MAMGQVNGMNVAQVIEFYGTDPRTRHRTFLMYRDEGEVIMPDCRGAASDGFSVFTLDFLEYLVINQIRFIFSSMASFFKGMIVKRQNALLL
jgi:hypothetical protein